MPSNRRGWLIAVGVLVVTGCSPAGDAEAPGLGSSATTLMPLEKGSDDRYGQLREPITVVVNFDDEGFELEEYGVAVDDTLRFTNQSSSSLTVYILSEDGQSAATQLLSLTQSQVQVGSSSYVDREVGGTGPYLFSLDPAPQDPPEGSPLSGSRVVIIVSS